MSFYCILYLIKYPLVSIIFILFSFILKILLFITIKSINFEVYNYKFINIFYCIINILYMFIKGNNKIKKVVMVVFSIFNKYL